MKKTSPKIVFFGSGPVAAESLRQIAREVDVEIEAIITKSSTLKEMSAVLPDASIYSVNTKSELDDLVDARNFESNLGILIDFGIIVSQKVIDSFELGIINSHFSILPQWRGADPITFAILSGQKKTGVSLMLLVAAMDEGPILAQGIYNIKENETTPKLTSSLIKLSTSLLRDTVPAYISDLSHPKTGKKVVARSQEEVNKMCETPVETSYSRKLTKNDGILDFNKPAEVLEREIRAFIEWPKSRTTIADKDVVITKAHAVPSNGVDERPGDITPVRESGLIMVATSNGWLCIESLKPAGKNEMSAKAFLAGYGNKL